jgi:hypothetical protein
MIKPYWFTGTSEEWEKLPAGAQAELKNLSGSPSVRDQRMKELIASVRGEVYNPQSQQAKIPQATKTENVFFRGIRNWNVHESVDGIIGTRIRDCIIFLLDVKRDPWYISNCNNIEFVKRFAVKMHNATPLEYHFESDPVVDWRIKDFDGQPVLQTYIKRDPKNEEERREIKMQFGIGDATIPHIADPACKLCHGKGYVYGSAYPDDPSTLRRLEESYWCLCLKRFDPKPKEAESSTTSGK